jgi:hypothetical protein
MIGSMVMAFHELCLSAPTLGNRYKSSLPAKPLNALNVGSIVPPQTMPCDLNVAPAGSLSYKALGTSD